MKNSKISSIFYTVNKKTKRESDTTIVYKSGLVRKSDKLTQTVIDFIQSPEVKKRKLNESLIEEFYMMSI